MPEPFALTTPDPNFDPREPITVNGYCFIPTEVASKLMSRMLDNRSLGLRPWDGLVSAAIELSKDTNDGR
jgi:hypothetical protein